MRWSTRFLSLGLVLLFVFGLLGGCEQSGGDPSREAPEPVPADQARIVSLSPAISRTLVDLGIDDRIVGRTPFCESLDRSVPVVGDLLNLDYEQLLRVRPTHVFVQPQASGMDTRLLDLAEEHHWVIGAWRLNDIADIQLMLAEVPEVLHDDKLIARAVELHIMADEALRPSADAWNGRVLLVAGVDPIGVFGTGTYLHDVLSSLGARNAVTLANYPQLTLEDVTRLNPDAIILIRPGAPEDLDPVAAMRSLARLQIRAVEQNKVAVLSHEDAFMPSTGIIGVAEQMRAILDGFAHAPSEPGS